MTIADRLPHAPSQRQVGITVQLLSVAGLAMLAALVLAGFAHQRGQLADVRRVATSAQDAASANEQGLRKANARLEAAGKPQVPIPAPQPGRPGATGATGPAGANGAAGAAGTPGTPGLSVVGPQGATGPAGSKGDAGTNGVNGVNGADGASVTGPAGPAGPAGQDGKDGTDGKDGAAGQPPFSWTWTNELGQQETCRRADPFDPDQPTYTCTTDGS